jgi:hypothetical protein
VRDDRLPIRTRNELMELIAHALCLQLSYLSKDRALAVADTILAPSVNPALTAMANALRVGDRLLERLA